MKMVSKKIARRIAAVNVGGKFAEMRGKTRLFRLGDGLFTARELAKGKLRMGNLRRSSKARARAKRKLGV